MEKRHVTTFSDDTQMGLRRIIFYLDRFCCNRFCSRTYTCYLNIFQQVFLKEQIFKNNILNNIRQFKNVQHQIMHYQNILKSSPKLSSFTNLLFILDRKIRLNLYKQIGFGHQFSNVQKSLHIYSNISGNKFDHTSMCYSTHARLVIQKNVICGKYFAKT